MSGEHKTVIQKTNSSKYVKLNVGGKLFLTTIETLTKHDTMLRAMFSGRMEVLTDSDGWILIDRSGKHFDTILNFLRDNHTTLPDTEIGLMELEAEARYYIVQDLVNIIEPALKKKREVQPSCQVPLLTSTEEEQNLFANTHKPVIKLSCNRHNNKYSYTNNSDDNFLKNIELFDKLSLQFSNRLLLIKDVIGTVEICCWYFYSRSQKVGEVCCTSIVYGTDKKHTKVDYPEARIFEETLNVLCYENVDIKPDKDFVMPSRSGSMATVYHSDEDLEERLDRHRLRKK
ncbi:POZ domain-containing adapter for CUL3-mediated degradation 3-like [Octopus vulgaris]|uniref:POZ domain-containing adapter for CUL3-mediated degradation 3-like n=3 Tax=Octopus TaxID=6643 RepID=A0AA36BU32_OCTVU|nr:BTB/POZ domain-containing adapter for CUL3-mediated RhoA degradation protein 3 [Octopus bimaculoides]XP_029650986.1 BTB/POZ domain-containing adapter for CUL3-mediated RhoA degradation protein 3 [Octopus sinensis]CAI9740643.1 POZ domain-containing adapter for CUL3-mediated degradation 3-like [Octopus vulgaris]|eukprot:XP_014775529.1 PREDICTED: BTB/POZ domain-containing adapter for CUL3-mediated RhoA degradation protein 3-like [Octopus bimaculoides]